MCAELRERLAEAHDGVDARRARAVAAGVRRLQRKVLVDLLARLDLQRNRLAVLVVLPARAFVDRERGVEHFRLRLHQPAHAVEESRARRLLAAGQGELDVAARRVAFLPVADEAVREDRGHRLVVADAARVEPAVFLDQLEGVALPVLALRLDHVDVREQQDGLDRAVPAAQHGDQRAVFRRLRRRQDLRVLGRDSGREQVLLHRLGRLRAVADRARRVDLDQFLEERAERGFVGARYIRLRTRLPRGRQQRPPPRRSSRAPVCSCHPPDEDVRGV